MMVILSKVLVMGNGILDRLAVTLFLMVAWSGVTLGQSPPPEGPKPSSPGLPANLLDDEFIKEMVKTPIQGLYKGGRDKRTKTPYGVVVTHTNWEATVNGHFDADKLRDSLKVKVGKDERGKDGNGPVALHACAPITGTILCDLKSVGMRNVNFKATACLEMKGTIRHKADSADHFEIKATKWTGDLHDLTLDPNNVDIMDLIADKATKDVLSTSEDFKNRATISLDKAPLATAALRRSWEAAASHNASPARSGRVASTPE